ncbi:MAG: DDE-type integrase/transposase/recombinase [Candidatus Ornithomonoglobus sp.]
MYAILDLFARKTVSYKISNHINTQLAIHTLNIALNTRDVHTGLIFHTDRGSQFTAKDFRQHLDALNIVQLFSAKG